MQVGEEELRAEFQVNQAESQQAVSFAGATYEADAIRHTRCMLA